MPLTIYDDDQTDHVDGPPFRIVVFLPESIKRLIGRLLRRLLGGA